VVICLERSVNDLRVVHCYPIVSCFIKIQNGLTFLVLAYRGYPGKEAVKRVPVCEYKEFVIISSVMSVTFCYTRCCSGCHSPDRVKLHDSSTHYYPCCSYPGNTLPVSPVHWSVFNKCVHDNLVSGKTDT